jgi:hypothetical protein
VAESPEALRHGCQLNVLNVACAVAYPCDSNAFGLITFSLEIFAPAIRADSTFYQLALVWSLEVLALLTMLAPVWLVLVFGFRFADLLLLRLRNHLSTESGGPLLRIAKLSGRALRWPDTT